MNEVAILCTVPSTEAAIPTTEWMQLLKDFVREGELQSFPTLYLLQRHFGCHSSTYIINVAMLHCMGVHEAVV